MDEAANPTWKARWWHSRLKRKRLLALGEFALLAWLAWQWVTDNRDQQFAALAVFWAMILGEWAWFRFLDPQYPHDDLPRPESYSGPHKPEVPPEAWQGALAAAGVIGLIVLAIWLA